MADNSQEITNENMDMECDFPEEQPSQDVIQKVMEQVHEMVEQNKFTVLHRVIELSIEHINQKKEIMKLQQSIKKVLEERMQTKSDLFIQHNFQKNVQQIEDLNRTTSVRVREKLETINELIKSNEALRAQLKEDDGMARLEMDEIKKLLDALTGKANSLEHSVKKGENRLKDLSQLVQNASAEKDKIQQECHAKECEMSATLSKQADIMQTIKNQLMENKSKIQQLVEELQREQQKLREQTDAYDQLQAENETLQNSFHQLKQTTEAELEKKNEYFTKQIEFSEKSFDDMIVEKEKLIEDMTNNMKTLDTKCKATEERINELNDKRSKLADELQKSKERNVKLKQELGKFNRSKQQDMELAKLQEAVKAAKPNKILNNCQKKSVLIKAKHGEKGGPSKDPMCVISDSDLSDSFEKSVYFEGKL
ncbi:CAP-Gly domain-containing linker protein 1-like [Anopheles maculipalpis]|uniref:CAP-Gly domain-containing linker protein 1-like n=1 Tax=Anopheles maculipalpis TaxID=1496333 RepID=UPI002158E974|nr:CAP-Gly domain-containing linker protein 1-like [Anopheles maculipalpis]